MRDPRLLKYRYINVVDFYQEYCLQNNTGVFVEFLQLLYMAIKMKHIDADIDASIKGKIGINVDGELKYPSNGLELALYALKGYCEEPVNVNYESLSIPIAFRSLFGVIIDPCQLIDYLRRQTASMRFLNPALQISGDLWGRQDIFDNPRAKATRQGGSNKKTDDINATTAASYVIIGVELEELRKNGCMIGRDKFVAKVRDSMDAKGQGYLFHLTTARSIFNNSSDLQPFKIRRGRPEKQR